MDAVLSLVLLMLIKMFLDRRADILRGRLLVLRFASNAAGHPCLSVILKWPSLDRRFSVTSCTPHLLQGRRLIWSGHLLTLSSLVEAITSG